MSGCLRCCEYALLILEYWADAPEIQRSADLYEDLIKCCVADAMSEVRDFLFDCKDMLLHGIYFIWSTVIITSKSNNSCIKIYLLAFLFHQTLWPTIYVTTNKQAFLGMLQREVGRKMLLSNDIYFNHVASKSIGLALITDEHFSICCYLVLEVIALYIKHKRPGTFSSYLWFQFEALELYKRKWIWSISMDSLLLAYMHSVSWSQPTLLVSFSFLTSACKNLLASISDLLLILTFVLRVWL